MSITPPDLSAMVMPQGERQRSFLVNILSSFLPVVLALYILWFTRTEISRLNSIIDKLIISSKAFNAPPSMRAAPPQAAAPPPAAVAKALPPPVPKATAEPQAEPQAAAPPPKIVELAE